SAAKGQAKSGGAWETLLRYARRTNGLPRRRAAGTRPAVTRARVNAFARKTPIAATGAGEVLCSSAATAFGSNSRHAPAICRCAIVMLAAVLVTPENLSVW